MKILGIDPGYALIGWSLVEFDRTGKPDLQECGVVETSPDLSIQERLEELYNDIKSLAVEFKPDYAGIETLMFHKNAKTAMSVSEARGVILLALQQELIPVKQVTPLQVKSAVTGYGKATKSQVQESVKMLCGLKEVIKPDDAADAVAVAICTFSFVSKHDHIHHR